MDIQKRRFLHIHISASREEAQVAGAAYCAMPSCLKMQYIMRESVTNVSKNTRKVILIDLE